MVITLMLLFSRPYLKVVRNKIFIIRITIFFDYQIDILTLWLMMGLRLFMRQFIFLTYLITLNAFLIGLITNVKMPLNLMPLLYKCHRIMEMILLVGSLTVEAHITMVLPKNFSTWCKRIGVGYKGLWYWLMYCCC